MAVTFVARALGATSAEVVGASGERHAVLLDRLPVKDLQRRTRSPVWRDRAVTSPGIRADPECGEASGCHDGHMQPPRRDLARVVTWSLMPALLAATFASDVGRTDGTGSSAGLSDLLVIVAMVACWLVGVVVTGRAPEQRAGWAFLGLGTAMAWSAFCDDYSELGRVGDRDVPAWRLFATLGDTSFVWWFVFLALVLLYTPPGPRQGMARWLPTVTVVSGVVFQVMALLRSTPLDRPREELSSPLAVPAVSAAAELVGAVAIYTLAACLLASVALLVRAWRRAEGESAAAAALAGGRRAAPRAGRDRRLRRLHRPITPRSRPSSSGAAMVALVVGAGLSVLRYRLYDVERVVTESAAYAIASAAVIVAYIAGRRRGQPQRAGRRRVPADDDRGDPGRAWARRGSPTSGGAELSGVG